MIKKKIVFTTSSLLFFVCLLSCKQKMNSLTEEGIKGNVKTIEQTHYTTTEKFGKVEDGFLIQQFNYSYNKEGFKTDETWYDGNGKLSQKFVYEYGKDGNLTKNSLYSSNGDLDYSFSYTYKYNADGKPIEGIEKYNSEFSSKRTYSRDDKGRLIEEKEIREDGNIAFRYVYKYEGENKVEYIMYNSRTPYKTTFKYDDENRLIERTDYKPSGEVDKTEKYSYLEFDNKGNWTKRMETIGNFHKQVTKRKIEYY